MELALPVVEDRIWSFLRPDATPLAAHAPALTHVVDGLSKRVAPGLTAGFLVVPPHRVDAVAAAVRSGGGARDGSRWRRPCGGPGTGPWTGWWRRSGRTRPMRQRILAAHLGTFAVRTDPHAYFAWWELPSPWRADTFTAAAAAHGVAVTPGTAFAVDPHRTPDAVRLGLASATEGELAWALRRLAWLARESEPPGGAGPGGPPVRTA